MAQGDDNVLNFVGLSEYDSTLKDYIEDIIESHGLVDYSTTEFNTGRKWTDGKSIYGKVIPNVYVEINSYGTGVALGLAVDKVLRVEPMCGTHSSQYTGASYLNYYQYETSGNNTQLYIATYLSAFSADIYVEYTKP